MAVTRRNQNQYSQLLASGSTARLVEVLGQAAGNAIKTYLKSGSKTGPGSGGGESYVPPGQPPPRGQRKLRRRKRTGGGGQNPNSNAGAGGSVVRIPGNFFGARKRFVMSSREIVYNNSSTTGTCTGGVFVACTQESSIPTLVGSFSRVGSSLFSILMTHQYVRFLNIRVRATALAGTTTAGYLAIGYVPTNASLSITDMNQFNNMASVIKVCTAGDTISFSFKPSNQSKDGATMIYTATQGVSGSSVDAPELFSGQIKWLGEFPTNQGPASMPCMLLEIDSDVEVYGHQ